MRRMSRIATTAAIAGVSLSAGVASASATGIAFDPNPYAFTGSSTSTHTFSLGGIATTCDGATFTGNTSNATSLRLPFRASFSDCHVSVAGIVIPATVTTHSDWALSYVSGDAAMGVVWNLDFESPNGGGTAVTISIPSVDCTIGMDPQSGLSSVSTTNATFPYAVRVDANVTGIAYHSDGTCPGVPATGTDGAYAGSVEIPGITMTDA